MFKKPDNEEKSDFTRNIKVTPRDHPNNLRPKRKSKAQRLKEIGNSAIKLYTSLDLFGKPIILKYDGQPVFKSIYGTTMSFSVLGCMLAFFMISFILFIQRKNLSFSFLSESKPSPDIIDFGTYNGTLDWIVGVDIINEEIGLSANDPSLFKFHISYEKATISSLSSNSDLVPITLPCTESESFMTKVNPNLDDSQTYYDFYNMNSGINNEETALCFRLNKFRNITDGSIKDITLEGNQISELHTYISIKLEICNNVTAALNGITCRTPEEIKQQIDYSYVRFYFTHERFLPDGKVPYPVVNSTIFYRYNIQKYFSKRYDLFLQQNRINDFYDIMKVLPIVKGLFSFSDDSNFSLDYVTEQNFGRPKFPLLEITINGDKVRNTYVRKFMNIKEFFVDVVGILNGLWAGGKAVGQIINEMLLKRDLINKSFWVVDEDEQEHSKKKEVTIKKNENKGNELTSIKKKPSFKILDNDLNNNNSINKSDRKLLDKNSKDKDNSNVNLNEINKAENSIDESDSFITEGSTKKENEIKVAGYIGNRWYNSEALLLPNKSKKFTHFNMTFSQLIMSMFPCFKDKKLIANKKIFNDCGEIIDSYFNIENIVSSIREYENLRNVVLTSEEYKMLKMITTPKIEIKGEDIVINKPEKQLNNEENLKTMYLQYAQSVNRLVRSPHLTTAEYNLLELHKISHLKNKNKEKKL